jgi:plasmid stabilization system protein ParE
MVKTVKWNKSATSSLSALAEYLEHEASYDTAIRFVNLVYAKIDKLMKYPEIGRIAPKTKSIRLINVDKKQRMYYRKHGSILYIVWFFDTRQDPDKNPYH